MKELNERIIQIRKEIGLSINDLDVIRRRFNKIIMDRLK